MEGFLDCVQKMGILFEVRRLEEDAPRFADLWDKRAKLIEADPLAQKSYTSYPTYPTEKDPAVSAFCKKVSAQLTLYRNKTGMFARDWVLEAAEDMPAHLWWDQYGASVPELQFVACLVLAQPASASICERINSEFAFVKDRRRNRLAHARADKLVSLFHNLRLLARMRKTTYVEPAVGWTEDEGLDAVGITKYGVAHYK